VGDPDAPSFIIARANDPRRLLTRHQARLISVLPKEELSALGAVATAAHLPRKTVDILLWGLADAGLVRSTARNHWQLSEEGARHFQRDAKRRPAKLLRLPVYSDRVISVLGELAEQGPKRAMELSEKLGVPGASMNALMQYLKRRELVRKTGLKSAAPHALTALGRDTLDSIRRRARSTQQ
jgi:DNA-binding IclR family transcriptional regulator